MKSSIYNSCTYKYSMQVLYVIENVIIQLG